MTEEKRRYTNMVKVFKDSEFWVSDSSVTQAFYEKVMRSNPSIFVGDDERPVENVTWKEAIRFCERLNEMQDKISYYDDGGSIIDIQNTDSFRLLTKAEWELCCYDNNNLYAGTSSIQSLSKFALYRRQDLNSTQKVKQLKPNSYGLYDMCGNVWEWVYDKYGVRGDKRYLLGGAFDSSNVFLKRGRNGSCKSTNSDKTIGFRICRGAIK